MGKSSKKPDSIVVTEYMEKLNHPLRPEIEEVRKIISTADPKIAERIKWNAPSYYYKEDIVTFNHRNEKKVHLVFHHPSIVKIKSELLEGDYKDRRMMYFDSMTDIKKKKSELTRIMKEMIVMIDAG